MTFHYNMSADTYHSHEANGSGDISKALNNITEYWMCKYGDYQREDTQALKIGRAFHVLLLENDKFNTMYQVCPYDDKRTKAYKEWLENCDKSIEVISNKEYEEINDLYLKAMSSNHVRELLEHERVHKEASFFADIDGIPCKARTDIIRFISDDEVIIVDPKTMYKPLNKRNIENAIVENNYHIQQAHYELVLRENGLKIVDYLFWCFSKDKFSDVCLVKNNAILMDQAYEDHKKGINKIKRYQDKYGTKTKWKEIVEEVYHASVPQWAFYKYQGEENENNI
ncbi:MAG: PD-(D/E)XK nuclease-like domain-containing protein [Candidatus Riesia sp.]|nr:PD-(D/E)XK nuclease-like domain-containing protein [Candidatus Riesia sp.]